MTAHAKRAVLLTLLSVTLTACQTTTFSGTDNERRTVQFYCDNANPFKVSRSDTPATIEAAAANIATYLTHCDENGKARPR